MAFLFILLSDLFAVLISLGLTVFVFSFLSYCVCPVGVIGFLGIFAASEENKHEEQMAEFRENCAKEREQKGKAKKRRAGRLEGTANTTPGEDGRLGTVIGLRRVLCRVHPGSHVDHDEDLLLFSATGRTKCN